MNKILVSYFSATGVTKEVAKRLAEVVDGDLFEIEPKKKYTTQDLNWNSKLSRSSIEMSDNTSRPQIVSKISNIENYDTILIGFPIWWYTAPRIINTFIEENDFDDKDIYIFVTSGGTGVSNAFNDLKRSYPNLRFINAKRFTDYETMEEYELLLEKEDE